MGDKLLGRRINAARKDRGITSERLSELCNINDTYMRQIESGAKIPSLPVFVTICKELRVDVYKRQPEVHATAGMWTPLV